MCKKQIRDAPNSLYALVLVFLCGLLMVLIPPAIQLYHYTVDNSEYAEISGIYHPPEPTPVIPIIVATTKETSTVDSEQYSYVERQEINHSDVLPDLVVTTGTPVSSNEMEEKSTEIITETDSTEESTNSILSQEIGENSIVLPSESTALTKEDTCDNGTNSVDDRHDNRSSFEKLKEQNKDFIAWLSIPGTPIDYPVVQSNDTEYYLNHLFTGTKSKLGCLFSLKNVNYRKPGHNIAIYGHHLSASDAMFSSLLNYKDERYYQSHPTIQLNSLYHNSTYHVFAALNMNISEWDPAAVTFQSDKAFLQFVNRAIKKTKYDTGVEVTENDKILTLITCDRSYGGASGRFIVMAVLEE